MFDFRVLLMVSLALAGCMPQDQSSARAGDQEDAGPQISPQDFVLLPCGGDAATPCVFVMAGGKSLLFGAPAGISTVLDDEQLASIEASFLFSLRYEDTEGLDEIRNRGWRAGRAEQLTVSGPLGVAGLLEGLNLGFEQSDALTFVEDGAPAGGFDAALLTLGASVAGEQLIFDTGDLKVRAIGSGTRRVTYRIGYLDIQDNWHDVVLQPCNGPQMGEVGYLVDEANRHRFGCDQAAGMLGYPLEEAYFVEKSKP